METPAASSSTSLSAPPPQNPHVLWRQVLGLVLWVGVLTYIAGGLVAALFGLVLGGVTLADAWKSGIYKRPGEKRFLNLSPMAWGIAMALLFIVTYPVYLLQRNKLRTIQGTNAFYWATVVVGAIVIVLLLLSAAAYYTK